MKRCTHLFLALLVLPALVMAAAPTFRATDAVYDWDYDSIISSAAAHDTLISTTDSSVLLDSTWRPDRKWNYVLVRDAITGGGSDSVKVQLMVEAFDADRNKMYQIAVDSLTAAAGEAIEIPIGGTLLGNTFRVTLIGYTDNGGEVILNRISMMRRRGVQFDRRD